jgi:hypothetical protein
MSNPDRTNHEVAEEVRDFLGSLMETFDQVIESDLIKDEDRAPLKAALEDVKGTHKTVDQELADGVHDDALGAKNNRLFDFEKAMYDGAAMDLKQVLGKE